LIFTSYTYILFLATAFALHWLVPERWRKWTLIGLSYVFYCAWRWEYAFLLLGVSLFNWRYGLLLSRRGERPGLLGLGVAVNLAPLLYFKYTGFFVQSLSDVAGLAGAGPFRVPQILLPLGISFFTFQGIAYLVDVATGETPFRRAPDFLLFKGFWPQLIAGPIIRPAEIREQIEGRRCLEYGDVSEGLRRIVLGFLKKVVLADNLAPTVEMVFAHGARPGMVDSAVGLVGFGLQIYFDFSAYSDIAIGSARLFGFRFPENFDWPYLASSPRAFWERWHMTLSRWIRDYLFTPMAFTLRDRRAWLPVAVVGSMAICGLWHGAAWTFVVWGVWHGLMLLSGEAVRSLTAGRRVTRGLAGTLAGWSLTTAGVLAGWALFRAESLGDAAAMLTSILTLDGGLRPRVLRENAVLFVAVIAAGTALVHAWRALRWRPAVWAAAWGQVSPVALPALYALAVAVVIVADRGSRAFVYFQF
jgi:alginate O-acetyltransferase complex protein AlgI